MQFAFNFPLKKMIFFIKHNNSINVGINFAYISGQKNEIFWLII
jgi:hypothetical protein